MTRAEFLSRQTDAQRRIRRRVVPFGIVYMVQLGMFGFIPYLLQLLYRYFDTTARAPILYELGFCALLLASTFFVLRDGRRRYATLAPHCPACRAALVFDHGKTAQTGCCWRCGTRVFDS